MAVPFLGWLRVDPAHNDFYVGADAYNRGDVEASIPHLQDAVDDDSSVMVYRMLLGIAQAAAYLLEWPAWGGYLAMAALLGVAAIIAIQSGRTRAKKVPAMPRTVESLKETKEWMTDRMSSNAE